MQSDNKIKSSETCMIEPIIVEEEDVVDDVNEEEDIDDDVNDEEQTVEFVDLLNHPDYEILNQYPFTIRRKKDHYEVSECIDKTNGYIKVNLNQKRYYKHRLIALQFLPNPNNYNEIDHINRDRTDYHIENLRWCSRSTNQKNKTSHLNVVYEFITDLPDDAIKIDTYGDKMFPNEQYYYANVDDQDRFYMRITDDGLYKIMHINVDKKNLQSVWLVDKNNKRVQVCLLKFKHLYDLNE